MDLKKKHESQVQLLKQKQSSDEAAKRLQDEIQSIKAQKVLVFWFSMIFFTPIVLLFIILFFGMMQLTVSDFAGPIAA